METVETVETMDILLEKEVDVHRIEKFARETTDVENLKQLWLFVSTSEEIKGTRDQIITVEYYIKGRIKHFSGR